MSSNAAAWLTTEKAKLLEVESAPYSSPGEHETVVKNGAVAVNPADWAIQEMGNALFPLEYPHILGSDNAGEVVEIGSSVTRFRKGDRVLGLALFLSSNRESAFQEYTVFLDHMTSEIPRSLSFHQYPSVNPKSTGKTLIVWGGATSVGSSAVQLGVASGYEVITTASPKNFNYVKKLGASQAFDYNSKTIADELIAALKDKTTAGVFCSTGKDGVVETCAETLLKTSGGKFIALCMRPPEKIPNGISCKFIFCSDLKDNEVSKVIFDDFLPRTLAEGKFVAVPDPHVVGKGFEHLQEAFDLHKNGVSATKIVVSL